MKRIPAAIAIGIVLFCVIVAWRITEHVDQTTVDVLVGVGVTLLVSTPCAALLMVIALRSRGTQTTNWSPRDYQDDYQVREIPDYRPPQARLMPAPVIVVPRLTHNGQATPYGMPARPVPVLRTTTANDQEASVPLNYLMRFLALDTPARSEWVGKPRMYGQALRFCETHGLLDEQSNGGARWKEQYDLAARHAWAEQFNQVSS